MPRPKPIRGMGIIADPYRGPAKKRGGKRPARPGWGQALLGRSRRGWSHGGELSPERKGYQQGRALTPRAVKSAWGLNRPGDAAAKVRSMSIPVEKDHLRECKQVRFHILVLKVVGVLKHHPEGGTEVDLPNLGMTSLLA